MKMNYLQIPMAIIMFVNCVSAVRKPVRCTPWRWDETDNRPGPCACTLPFLEILQVQLMQMPNVLGTVENLWVIWVVLCLLC